MTGHNFNLENGYKIFVVKEDLEAYQGSSNGGCILYMKDSNMYFIKESFETVHNIFNL